jgi:hypothetical protein
MTQSFRVNSANTEDVLAEEEQVEKIAGGHTDTIVYYLPIKFRSTKSDKTVSYIAIEGCVCATTSPEKSFLRIAVPNYVFNKVAGVFTHADEPYYKKPSQATSEFTQIIADKHKWKAQNYG